MLEARQRSITESIMLRSGDAPAASRVLPPASLVGRSASGTSRNFIRVGSGTPAPNANTSPVPSEGTKVSMLAPASEIAERISAWSRSFDSRITNMVLHWEMMLGSISAGRWVTRPRNTPYFRPSLAIRDSARRVGPKPILESAGA